jgi:hypothetical protein
MRRWQENACGQPRCGFKQSRNFKVKGLTRLDRQQSPQIKDQLAFAA